MGRLYPQFNRETVNAAEQATQTAFSYLRCICSSSTDIYMQEKVEKGISGLQKYQPNSFIVYVQCAFGIRYTGRDRSVKKTGFLVYNLRQRMLIRLASFLARTAASLMTYFISSVTYCSYEDSSWRATEIIMSHSQTP